MSSTPIIALVESSLQLNNEAYTYLRVPFCNQDLLRLARAALNGEIIPTSTLNENNAKKPIYHETSCLVVDDNETNLIFMEKILSLDRIEVSTAIYGQDALENMLSHFDSHHKNYNLIFMDIMMPIMDGYTCMQTIPEHPLLQSLHICALTANATTEEQNKCLKTGANSFFH